MDADEVRYRTLLRLCRNGYFNTDDEKAAFQFTEKGKAVWDSAPEDAKGITDNAAVVEYQKRIDHLRDELSDADSTEWTCPDCGRFEPKGCVIVTTGEHIPFRPECDECGFDATPYAEAEIIPF